jgi:hypothetical protein
LEEKDVEQLEVNLTEWFLEGTFLAALLFAVVYIPFFDWRATVTGRATTTLILSIAGALLHSVLLIWGVIGISVSKYATQKPGGVTDQVFTWISVVSLGGAGLSILILGWQSLRYMHAETNNKFLRWILNIY